MQRLVAPTRALLRASPRPSLRLSHVPLARTRDNVVARVASGRAQAAGGGDSGDDGGDAGADAAANAANASPSLDTTPPAPAPAIVTPDTPPFARRAYESLTRARWYRWYLGQLERRPTLTKALTACCGFVVGDLIAQSLSGGGVVGGGAAAAAALASASPSSPLSSLLAHVDWARTARMGAFGLFVDGPVGGAYYAWLDKTIWPDDPLSARTVITKTVLDQTVYSALGTVAFFTFIRLLETGGDVGSVAPTLAAKFWPTLCANYAIWPVAHLINFRFVPPPLRVLYNQVIAVGWLTLLSILAHSPKAPPVAPAAAAAVAALAHKGGAAGGGGGAAASAAGGWLESLLSALPHF
jgi:protein Mpv17